MKDSFFFLLFLPSLFIAQKKCDLGNYTIDTVFKKGSAKQLSFISVDDYYFLTGKHDSLMQRLKPVIDKGFINPKSLTEFRGLGYKTPDMTGKDGETLYYSPLYEKNYGPKDSQTLVIHGIKILTKKDTTRRYELRFSIGAFYDSFTFEFISDRPCKNEKEFLEHCRLSCVHFNGQEF